MHLEPLESRQLYSASLSTDGVLTITGSEANDYVSVSQKSGTILVIESDVRHIFAASKVRRVVANLGAGRDKFVAQDTFKKPITVDGGAGADDIQGGAGNDRLLGGDGNDSIDAGKGRDTIVGGAGSDLIDAGTDQPTLPRGSMSLVYIRKDMNPDVIETGGDGARDRITCNDGDTVHADKLDKVKSVAWSGRTGKIRPMPLPAVEIDDLIN